MATPTSSPCPSAAPQHILLATDFSSPAQRAAEEAARLARRFGARVTLLHAVQLPALGAASPFIPVGTDTADLETELRGRALEQLRGLELNTFTGVAVTALETPSSRSATAAICAAAKHDVDLIVLGTHGLTGASRAIFGSVAETVVRHAPVSVLTVPPTDAPGSARHAAEHWLVATDFSEPSLAACTLVDAWARRSGAWVTLLHVCTNYPPPYVGPMPIFVDAMVSRDRDRIAAAEKRLLQVRRRLFGDDLSVSIEATIGHYVPDVICERAGAGDVSHVAIGTLGRTGLSRLLIGSIAERVVRGCHRPVVSVRTTRRASAAA